MKKNDEYKYYFVVQDTVRPATKKEKYFLRGIGYKPIYVGVCNGIGENDKRPYNANFKINALMKRMETDGKARAISIIPCRDPQLMIERAIKEIGTVDAGGPLFNVDETQVRVEKPGYQRKYKTPAGVYKRYNAYLDTLSPKPSKNTFKFWCNYSHRVINTKNRMKWPELFEGHLTYADAGFGRLNG